MQLDFSPFGDSNYDSETVREPALREPLCTLNVHPNCIVTAERSEGPRNDRSVTLWPEGRASARPGLAAASPSEGGPSACYASLGMTSVIWLVSQACSDRRRLSSRNAQTARDLAIALLHASAKELIAHGLGDVERKQAAIGNCEVPRSAAPASG
jgi:hypothetical protein